MGRKKKQASGTPATVALDRAGIAYDVRAYEHDPAAESYGLEAASALGVDAGRVLKTLLVRVDGALAVGVVPVDQRLDLKAIAAALSGKRAEMADPHDAERSTGYVVGGISPIGQRRPLPTVVDSSAQAHGTVLVSGGRRGMDLELTPGDLVMVTSASFAPIAR